MRLQVKGKNVEVSDSIRRYAEEKLHKLDRQLHALTQVELELRVEKNPSISANQVAEATVWTKGPTLRAREASTDMKASIDQLTEKLLRQVEHYRAKRSRRQVRGNGSPPGGSMSITDEETGPKIVKTKQFSAKPMSAEEAAMQLDLVGHDFFVFRSDESGEVNVIYRRKDGGYGLIEPSGSWDSSGASRSTSGLPRRAASSSRRPGRCSPASFQRRESTASRASASTTRSSRSRHRTWRARPPASSDSKTARSWWRRATATSAHWQKPSKGRSSRRTGRRRSAAATRSGL